MDLKGFRGFDQKLVEAMAYESQTVPPFNFDGTAADVAPMSAMVFG